MDILSEVEAEVSARNQQREAWRLSVFPAFVSLMGVVMTVILPMWWMRAVFALSTFAWIISGLYWSHFWMLRSQYNLDFAGEVIDVLRKLRGTP